MSTPQLTLVPKCTHGTSDKVLAKRIARVFESDLAQAYTSGIRFFVQNGEVVVRGLVNNSADQQLLLFILRQVPGVRRVVNRSRLVRARVYYFAGRRAA
ncbi:MAG: hypothetical protein BMS9Abin05_0305 [Rhodothermia bacterium]|nr:MAG: hypothetical protein BMS9Abin05_0305 [Rhodothermia bacterium]